MNANDDADAVLLDYRLDVLIKLPFGSVLSYYRYRFGRRFRNGLSQAKLAEMTGVNHSYISRLESGDRQPSAAMVHSIADALQLGKGTPDRDVLLVAAGFRPDEPTSLLATPALAKLNAALTHADDETIVAVETMLNLITAGLIRYAPQE